MQQITPTRPAEEREHSPGLVGIRAGLDLAADVVSDACSVAKLIGDFDFAARLEDERSRLIDLAHIAGMKLRAWPAPPPLKWREREEVNA